MKSYDFVVKVIIVGSSGAGKSCMLLRFVDDVFGTNFIATIGLDFKIKTIEIDGKRVKLQIWDSAGQERFFAILPSYYRNAHAVMLVYDVTDEQSFLAVSRWSKQISEHAHADIPRTIIANKIDLVTDRRITEKQGNELAQEIGATYFETSCKTAQNINLAFSHTAQRALSRIMISTNSTKATHSVIANNNSSVTLKLDPTSSYSEHCSCPK
jgi:small GTP-binding protein